jgi:hypothetical protein
MTVKAGATGRQFDELERNRRKMFEQEETTGDSRACVEPGVAGSRSSGRHPRVAMVQTAQVRHCHHPASVARLDFARTGRVARQR